MESVERVALLALAYRELANECATGPRAGVDSLFDEYKSCPEEVSLLAMVGSFALTDLDWSLLPVVSAGRAAELANDLASVDLFPAEALMHTLPNPSGAGVDRCLDDLQRWFEVEKAMDDFRDLGVATSREDVELTAFRATGRDHDD
jgi:hypothetical protein